MHIESPFKSPFKRKSALQRLVDTIGDQLDTASNAAPDISSNKAVKTGLIAAGSAVGLTAGSAAVSSLRHRIDRERDDS